MVFSSSGRTDTVKFEDKKWARNRFIRTIRLENVLSYGPDSPAFYLQPLNVFIGPNASGKSNLIEALSVLAAAPNDIQVPFREGGGTREWLWKGSEISQTLGSIEVTVQDFWEKNPIHYRLAFTDMFSRFWLRDEFVEDENPSDADGNPKFYYQFRGGKPVIRTDGEASSERVLDGDDIERNQSILSQLRSPGFLSGLDHLINTLQGIRFYREFPVDRNAPARLPQQTDLPHDSLLEDASNLAVVLSNLQNQPNVKDSIQHYMQEFNPSVKDVRPHVSGGTVQVYVEEEGMKTNVPATRMSDGSLRFLCLLAALFSLKSPAIVCIEEPEMGLHPDAIPQLARLLVDVSKSIQVIVTTHSDILVDALTDTPEAVVICEKADGATQLRRLDRDDLKIWLEKYRLGELWTSGQLGGNLY